MYLFITPQGKKHWKLKYRFAGVEKKLSLGTYPEVSLTEAREEVRLAAGLSQKQLGIAAGIDEFSASVRLNHYETGRHTPDYSMLKRIGKILKLPIAYFYAESHELAETIKIFNSLKKLSKLKVIQVIKNEHTEY